MATVDLPQNIELQLIALDRRVRDTLFGRGLSRVGLVVPLVVGGCLLLDWFLGLGSGTRTTLLITCIAVSAVLVVRELLIPLWRRASLAELAALVEREHPELKERLTSLIELQQETTAGTSPVMTDLLARQTLRAVERLDLASAAPPQASAGRAVLALACCLALLAPFAMRPAEYSLLWARLLAPWGNFQWGAEELVLVDGDRVVARGSDVPVQLELRARTRTVADPAAAEVWLHWTDDAHQHDSRRMEWDAQSQRFTVTLPQVSRSLTLHATTAAARSEQRRVDVADPPVITRLRLDIEPPPYTGLPAQSHDGAMGEIRAPERSRIVMALEFQDPVATAELAWPTRPDTVPGEAKAVPAVEQIVRLELTNGGTRATGEALALHSGNLAIRLKNALGLTNTDPARSLVVIPDQPPAISLEGAEEPVAVRPNDRALVTASITDDYGLSDVELHLEASTGQTRIDRVPADRLRVATLEATFPIDVADFSLKPGQAVTYRVRAVDNRPIPTPQETWTRPRTLMIVSERPKDESLAERDEALNRQIADLRDQLAQTREAMEQLHQQIEKEALKQQNSDKSEKLAELKKQEQELAERIQQLAAELAQRPLTQNLAEQVAQLAEDQLADSQQRLDQVGEQTEPRDQLQPLSEAIDELAAVDKQLQGLEQQLNELGRLEQDLATLEQLARNTERLAEQLEQLEKQQEGDPAARQARREELLEAGRELTEELQSLLKKHPELLDAARREQLRRLEELAQATEDLARPQDQLAQAFRDDADTLRNERGQPRPDGATPEAANPDPANEAQPDGTKPENGRSGVGEPEAGKPEAGKPEAGKPEAGKPEAGGPSAKENSGNGTPRVPSEGETRGPIATGREPRDGSQGASEADGMPMGEPGTGERPEGGAGQPEERAREAGARAVEAQSELAQAAARLARELAEQRGADAPESEAAADFARKATEAAQQAQTGDLSEAAQSGQAAAESADQVSDVLQDQNDPQGATAADLAARQQEIASQMQGLAESPAARSGARQRGQETLADATEALARALDQAANELASDPLNSEQGSTAANQARDAAGSAERAMRQAAAAAERDPERAAEQAALAAEQLQQAARQAQSAPESGSESAIPEDLAARAAEAARQLQRAQQQLDSALREQPRAESGQADPAGPQGQPMDLPMPGESGESQPAGEPSGEMPGEGQPGQGQPGQGQPGQGQPGQGQPGQGQPGQGQPGQGQPGQGQPGQGQPGQGQPGQGQPGQGQPGQGQPGQGQPGQGQPGQGQPGQGQPGQGQPGQGQPGQGQPGQGQPGQGQPGQGQPGQGQPGQGQPGQGQPGQGQPGQGQPGQGQPGQGQPGQGQPGQGQPGQGQPGQGQPGQGQPGQGQPGQGQPGQGQPGQGQPGQGQPGQGQPGQGQPGQGQPGQGQPGQGQPGQGQPGLADSAQQFRDAANAMRQVLKPGSQSSNPAGQTAGGPQGNARGGQPGAPGGNPLAAGGGAADESPAPLDTRLKPQAQRNWGQLPGQLKTEILQGANKKPRPEYARQIKSYFDEISKPARPDAASK